MYLLKEKENKIVFLQKKIIYSRMGFLPIDYFFLGLAPICVL